MKNFGYLLNYLGLMIIIIISGCGYVSDKPPVNSEIFKPEALQPCKIEVDKLAEIFKTSQKEQINCLQQNFIQFTKYVRSTDSLSVSENELNTFVRKFFQGQSDSIVKGLSLIFQMNMLLLKDEVDSISKNKITPLFDILIKVNQEAVIITQIMKEMSDEKNLNNFWKQKEQFKNSLNRFSEYTVEIIKNSPGLQKKLNLKQFIIDSSNKLGNTRINSDNIDSLIFLKRLLVGGNKEIITTDELSLFISKLPKILSLSFDLYYLKNSDFTDDVSRARFYLTSIRTIYEMIIFSQNDFELFTIDQLFHLAQDFFKNTDIQKFKPSIISLKKHLLRGSLNSFSLIDLKNIVDLTLDFSERSYFNLATYKAHKETLEKNDFITLIKKIDLPQHYDLFSNQRIEELHQDFQKNVINFRYFRSKNEGIPYYGNKIIRSQSGFIEASNMKWASLKLLKSYGHNNALGSPQVSLEEFQNFLFDMKPILLEFNLWSLTPETFARNAVYLADLFQNNSNGDSEVNVYEATDYILMILTAVKIADVISIDMVNACNYGSNKELPLFNTDCFNAHFFDKILIHYKYFFPRLAEYIDPRKTSSEELSDFLKGVEGFSRDDPNPDIPINQRDNTLIIGSILNIETTFIRFDSNKNNIIDYQELLNAFKIYKSSIISIAKLKPAEEVYAQSIFLYMASKMEIPDKGSWMKNAKFFAYHKCVTSEVCRNNLMDKIEAKRLNIGKLLFYMVNQNPNNFL